MRQVGPRVWQVCAGAFPANSYVWLAPEPGEALLIDAGLDAAPIDAALVALGVRPRAVFCTHGHFDHIGTASFFQEKYAAPVHLHADDLKVAKAANFLMMAFKIPAKLRLPKFDLLEGEEGATPTGTALVRHRLLPGHSPGSCFLQIDDVLFSGDTMYASGVGLSKIPGEQPAVLRRSLRTVWDTVAPETLVCPGHGRTALYADIKSGNRELAAFLAEPDHERAEDARA